VVRPPAFHEALLSWRVRVPGGEGVVFEVRVGRGERGAEAWSPWRTIGEGGEARRPGPIVTAFEGGRVDSDIVRSASARTFDAVQWRATAVEGGSGGGVTVERVRVVTTRRMARDAARGEERDVGGTAKLDVPFRSQRTGNAALSGRLCSPTSVAMVLAYWGVEAEVAEVAALGYDGRGDIYGNWPRNVQGAVEMGRRAGRELEGEVVRVGSWEEAAGYLRRGVPIVASFSARPGELRRAPYASTTGHLIVLTGLDGAGGVWVNDPACADVESGRLVYSMEDLSRVWLGRGAGTAYIIQPRAGGGGE